MIQNLGGFFCIFPLNINLLNGKLLMCFQDSVHIVSPKSSESQNRALFYLKSNSWLKIMIFYYKENLLIFTYKALIALSIFGEFYYPPTPLILIKY